MVSILKKGIRILFWWNVLFLLVQLMHLQVISNVPMQINDANSAQVSKFFLNIRFSYVFSI